MKIMQVVGNRPQFIKLAPVSRELRKRGFEEIIIHTGQHYDENMSDIFFEELGIPKPTCNLNIGSGTHAEITAKAMLGLEKVMVEYEPDLVMVYGDTNSTLAAAIVAKKLNLKLLHIEAGVRTYEEKNPEETNRVIVDRISDILCTPDRRSVENLKKEGVSQDKIFFTGDVMYDEFLYCAKQKTDNELVNKFSDGYILLTWHRQENTSSCERMSAILDFLQQIDYPIIFPMHPRTMKMINIYGLTDKLNEIKHLHVVPPVGYIEMIQLLSNCKLLVSDSGGTSKEASFVGKKCLYILNLKVWPELIENGNTQIVDFDDDKSMAAAMNVVIAAKSGNIEMQKVDFFGEGDAAVKIADIVQTL